MEKPRPRGHGFYKRQKNSYSIRFWEGHEFHSWRKSLRMCPRFKRLREAFACATIFSAACLAPGGSPVARSTPTMKTLLICHPERSEGSAVCLCHPGKSRLANNIVVTMERRPPPPGQNDACQGSAKTLTLSFKNSVVNSVTPTIPGRGDSRRAEEQRHFS